MVKCLPTMQEIQVHSLGWEGLLEKEVATHSSVLAWRIPGTGEPVGLPSLGSHRVGHDWSNLAAGAATGKTIALTIWTFVSKVMSLPFNMLSRFVTVYLPRSKCLLISWLQSPSSVILELKDIKSVTVSTFPPFTCHKVMGPDAMILVLWIYYALIF